MDAGYGFEIHALSLCFFIFGAYLLSYLSLSVNVIIVRYIGSHLDIW
jgi:hypothetical protein